MISASITTCPIETDAIIAMITENLNIQARKEETAMDIHKPMKCMPAVIAVGVSINLNAYINITTRPTGIKIK